MSRRRLAVAGVVVVLALAGCGSEVETSGLNLPEYQGTATTPSAGAGDAPDAGEDAPAAGDQEAVALVAASKKAVAATASVSMKGAVGDEYSVDLAFSGQDASGTMTLGAVPFRVILAGGQAWYRGDAEFYEAIGIDPKKLVAATDARWIPSGTAQIASIDLFTSRAAFFDDFLDPGPDVTATKETTVDGIPSVGLVNESGALFVASDTKLPVRLTTSPDALDQGITFSYDPVTPPKPPAADEILDPSVVG